MESPDNTRKTFMQSEESRVFIIGSFMLIAWVMLVAILFVRDNPRWADILGMGFTQTILGRAVGIAHGSAAGMSKIAITVLASYADIMFVMIVYPIIIYSYKYLVEGRFYKRHLKPIVASAQENVGKFSHWKIAGVFLFVWLPFMMTGVAVGSVLGFLLGLSTWVNMLTVALGNITAVVCWVYVIGGFFDNLKHVNKTLPAVITIGIIIFLVIMRIIKKKQNAK